MRRWAWLLISLLALAAVGSMCGASPRRGYSPVYGEQYGKSQGYAAGRGGAATWDTVTVMMFTDALSDVGIDTVLAASADSLDAQRNRMRTNRRLGRYIHSFRDGDSDTARVYRLGTGKDITSFAYGSIKQSDTDGYADASGYTMTILPSAGYVYTGPSGSQTRFLSMAVNTADRTVNLVYVPWEDIIPANATIVSAVLNVQSAGGAYTQYPDSVVAVQMTNPSDNKWWLVKGLSSRPNYAHASWAFQEDTNAATWTGTQQHEWSPTIPNRTHLWDFGKTSDWTGSTIAPTDTPNYIQPTRGYDIKLTNCVQSVVNGGVNNGIALFKCDDSSAANQSAYYAFDPLSGGVRRAPYFYVKYITKRYQKPFGTGEFAFVFQSDDGRRLPNKAWTDTLATYGAKMTLYIAEAQIAADGATGDTRGSTVAQMLEYHDAGNEVGSHSKTHKGSVGYQKRINAAGTGVASIHYDSLVVDYGPNWMYAKSDSLGRDLRNSQNWAKSFGSPTSNIGAYTQRALIDHGYRSYRGLSGLSFDREKYYVAPTIAYGANGDSLYAGAPSQYSRHVRNLKQIAPWDSQILLFGNKGTTSANAGHIDSVTTNIERIAFQRIGNDTRAIVTFGHDLKTGGAGDYPGEGLNADELGAAARVVRSWGGRFMTSGELADWYLKTADIIDYPFANGRTDTFQVFATDRVWGKPHGIDNRFIIGLQRPSLAADFDGTAPLPPTSPMAYSQNRSSILLWTPSASAEPTAYRVYRFFDGAADTVLLGTSNVSLFVDATAINGSPHNYYVTSVDAAGNESAPTATMTTTPGTTLVIPRPAYFAFWYQDALDSQPLSQDHVNKLAAYDCIVGGTHAVELNAETGYDGLLDRIRAINPDAVYLTYFSSFTLVENWHEFPVGSAGRRIWDYVASIPDSAGFAKKIGGGTLSGDVYSQKFYNYSNQTLADTVASILVDCFVETGVDGEYAGFFFDDADTTFSDWICNSNDCQALADCDGDEIAFEDDADEQEAVKDWHLDLVLALRREFAERGMQNRLIVSNTTWGRKVDPSPKDEQYMALLDGVLNESWNKYWPGPNIPTVTAKWDLALGWRDLLTHAQTAPPLVLWNTHADSSGQYMNEVVAYAHGGLVGANNDNDLGGSTPPTMGRRIAALNPGLIANAAYDTVAGNATADTLTVTTTSGLTARMVMSRNAGDILNQYAVWPYIITKDDGTILSRSAFWELPEEAGPPALVLQTLDQSTVAGDNTVRIEWGISSGALPSDFDGWVIRREPCDGCTDAIIANRPTVFDLGSSAYAWVDTGLTNGQEYVYQIAAVDVLDNETTTVETEGRTPFDETAPTMSQDLSAAGGPALIALDWSNVSAGDLLRYRVYRSELGEAFAQIDSTTASGFDDSTAVAGQEYTYIVKALDDDGNLSGASNQATASWAVPEPGTPSSLVVFANSPTSGQALLNWTAPDPAVGLTRYRIYRGPTNISIALALLGGTVYDEGTTAATYTDLNATADSTFYYAVTALFGAEEGLSSNIVSNKNPPVSTNARITDGLVALWEFDGLSGTTVPDVSGVGSALDLTLTSAGSSSWTPYALNFAGDARLQTSGSAAKISDAVIASGQVTVEMWIKPTVASQANPQRIFSLANDTSNRNITLGHGEDLGAPSTSIIARVRGETPFNSAVGTLSTSLVHVVYTGGTGLTARIYINGSQSTSATNVSNFGNWVNSYPLAIGNEVNNLSRPWAGEVHLVAAYDRALTVNEIQHNYAVGVPELFGPSMPAAPVLASASGGGGGISLAWNAVAGAAKYRVFRGTASGATTQIDSTTTATTYFDDAAIEGVAYFYRLKTVNGTGVASAYSNERSAAWNSTSDLILSSVTGTVAHGGEITIAGSGFGVNDVSADIWDDMESGSASNLWDQANPTGYPPGSITVTESGDNARHANSAFNTTTNFRGFDAGIASREGGDASMYTFAQYWVKLGTDWTWGTTLNQTLLGTNLANVKFFRMWNPAEGDITNENWVISFHGPMDDMVFGPENINGYPNNYIGEGFKSRLSLGVWHLLEFEYKESGVNVPDGGCRFWIDGDEIKSDFSWVTREDSAVLKRCFILGFYNSAGDGSTDDNHVYFDDFYTAPTWARVVIGNDPIYANCTHREIQIPSAWSTTAITATVNTGSFANGGAYLFVVSPDGTVSDGKPITVANP